MPPPKKDVTLGNLLSILTVVTMGSGILVSGGMRFAAVETKVETVQEGLRDLRREAREDLQQLRNEVRVLAGEVRASNTVPRQAAPTERSER